ncbi:MAG: hypothetical protein WCE38_24735 [Burkholderiales bacterium]
MKRLMIGIAAATLLSTASFATQADERGGRNGYSRGPTHSPAYSHAQRTAPRHYQPSRRHVAPPRHYGHSRSYGYRGHSGWGSHYRAPRHWGYTHRAYRRWH